MAAVASPSGGPAPGADGAPAVDGSLVATRVQGAEREAQAAASKLGEVILVRLAPRKGAGEGKGRCGGDLGG